MKVIFFSDIHGNKYAFDAFLEDLSNIETPYKLVFLGDFIGYYYNPNEIIEYCRKNEITCVLGNHDQYFLQVLEGKACIEQLVKKYGNSYKVALNTITPENINFLKSLEKNKVLDGAAKKAYACHGSPLDNLEGRIYPDTNLSVFKDLVREYDYVITGHTHHKMVRKLDKTTFINPGSLGQQRDGQGCSYIILNLDCGSYSFHTIEYPISNLEKDIDFYDDGRSSLKKVLRRKKY